MLLGTEQLQEAEILLTELVCKYPHHIGFRKQYCIVAHHQKKWQEAETRFDSFYQSFSDDTSHLWFFYLNTLYQLNKPNKLAIQYAKFDKKRFKGIAQSEDLCELQTNLLLRRYENISIKENTTHTQVSKPLDYLRHHDNVHIKPVIHEEDNSVLILCFDGLQMQAVQQYRSNRFSDAILYDSLIDRAKKVNIFDGLANYTT